MARQRRTECRVEGCSNPPHVYPSGFRVPYCAEHIHLRKGRQRNGLPNMTEPMRQVLTLLRESARRGYPFAALPPDTNHRTITTLIERDWIVESPGLDGVRYKATGRGLQTLALYEPTINRRDGLCPRCGRRPRNVRSSGKKDAYCKPCLKVIDKAKRDMGLKGPNPDTPCSRCKQRPRHRYAGGKYSAYCLHCERVRGRARIRRERRALLKSIRAGGPVPLCKRKGCSNPRRVFANSISSYCAECGPIMMRRWKLKVALKATLEKST